MNAGTTTGAEGGAAVTVPWIDRLCLAVRRADPRLRAWVTTSWEGGVRLALDIDGERAALDLRPRIDGPAYAHTASVSMAFSGKGRPSPTAEGILKAFVRLTERVDRGQLVLPKADIVVDVASVEVTAPELAPDGAASEDALQPVLQWAAVDGELQRRLHFAAYVALQSTLADDLYPHTHALGVPLSEEDLMAAWQRTSDAILEGRAPQKLGVYVHVPYCTVECTFCYCAKTEDFRARDMQLYVDRLVDEMATYGALVARNTVTSVYFGGGTPSLLTPPSLRRVFGVLYDRFRVPDGTQVVFEGNPDSLKPDKVAILANEGRVTRLTVGIQSMDPEVQKYIRRYNRHEDVSAAAKAARHYGIKHLNFDCIAGLEGQSMESFQADIRYLLSLEPDSIHINGFRPLPRTRFGLAQRTLDLEQEQRRDAMLDWGHEELARHGYAVQLQQDQHRTWDAANLQEYDLRRQNSSLMGLGYPARSHAFGEYFYVRDTRPGMVTALREQNAGERRFLGCPSPVREEMHKYMVTNIRAGFERAEFLGLFGMDAVDVFGEVLAELSRLGAVEITPRQVRFRTGNAAEAKMLRTLFYSDAQLQRAREVWGGAYDPSADYMRQLAYLIPPAD